MIFVITIGDIIFLGVIATIITVALVIGVRSYIVQRRCKHETYGETAACQAVCHDCGKDLGFIGLVRARDRKRNENGHE